MGKSMGKIFSVGYIVKNFVELNEKSGVPGGS
jgi:hypothetical protein